MTIVAGLLLLFLYQYRSRIGRITTPFFLAIVLAYLVNPLVLRLERKGIPKKTGILLVYLLFVLSLTAVTVFIIPELINNTKDLMNTLPNIASSYQKMLNEIVTTIRSSNWSEDIKNVLFREIQNGADMAQRFIAEMLRKALNALVETVTMLYDITLAAVIAYYFLRDGESIKNSTLSLFPRKWRGSIANSGRAIHGILNSFVQGQLLTALIVALLETGGLILVGVKYPLVLGAIGGIANIIPYFGPIIGAVPAVAIALIQSPLKALWTMVVFIIVQQIDGSFISPRMIEGRVGLHPVSTILAVLIGGEFFGILGMLIAVPAAAIIKVLLKRTVEAIV